MQKYSITAERLTSSIPLIVNICIGVYPEEDLFEANVELELPYGFLRDLCGPERSSSTHHYPSLCISVATRNICDTYLNVYYIIRHTKRLEKIFI
jgi:hypothetical protein